MRGQRRRASSRRSSGRRAGPGAIAAAAAAISASGTQSSTTSASGAVAAAAVAGLGEPQRARRARSRGGPAPTTAQGPGSVGSVRHMVRSSSQEGCRRICEVTAWRECVAAPASRLRMRPCRPRTERREALKAVFHEASGCTRCPQLAATRTHGRLRGGQRRRRPDVRRRGARGQRGPPRACRSSARRASCSTSCWRRSGWRARTSSSPTSSSAGRPATATRARPRSTTAAGGCSASSS